MESIKNMSTVLIIVIFSSLVLIVSFVQSSASPPNLLKYLPEATTKELKNNLKIMLTNAKIRQVPLAKKRSERMLSKLYKDERVLKEEINELENNLGIVGTNMKRQGLRVIEVSDKKQEEEEEGEGAPRRPKLKLSELTSSKIEEWKEELEEKQLELSETRSKIEEAKRIIKNPENYISVPTNYGRIDPDEVREREREILINDRLNMEFRLKIATKKELPSWMTDSW